MAPLVSLILVGAVGFSEPIAPAEVWRSHEEALRIEISDGVMHVDTESGVLVREGDVWKLSDRQLDARQPMERELPEGSRGLFVTSVVQTPEGEVVSVWADEWLWRDGESYLKAPAEGLVYDLSWFEDSLYAATKIGLFVLEEEEWTKVALPSRLPTSRVQGIVRLPGGKWAVGGIDGLWFGSPGDWVRIDLDPVRTMALHNDELWWVDGSGAVDKLDPVTERHFHDVLYGAVRRPFASSLFSAGPELWIGLWGGWSRRSETSSEEYLAMLGETPTTSVLSWMDRVWAGNQRGLFTSSGAVAGLEHVWVMDMAVWRDALWVGTHSHGVMRVTGSGSAAVDSLPDGWKVIVWSDRLVVGGPHGAVLYDGSTVTEFATDGLETTSLQVIAGDLWIGTPKGVYRFTD